MFNIYKMLLFPYVKLISWLRFYKFSEFCFAKDFNKGNIKRCAILCPGSNLAKFPPVCNDYDFVISINLAAVLDVDIDIMMVERLDLSTFGVAQSSLIKKRGCKVVFKNIWDWNSKNDTSCLDPKKDRYYIEIPLRLSKLFSFQTVCKYMKHETIAPSSWKSSLFNAVQVAQMTGAESIDIFGSMGDSGYIWECDDILLLDVPEVRAVKSQSIHGTRVGVNANDVFKIAYKEYISTGKVRVVK